MLACDRFEAVTLKRYNLFLMTDRNNEVEARWWDVRQKGTLAQYAAKTAMVGIMLTIVGERLIARSSSTVEPVISSNTELIRQDLEEPVEEMRQNAQDALGKLQNMEQDVADVKEFIAEEFGVDFNN